ncbi:MAG: sodium:solute symporter family protein [Actinomycetota bacterium]|nr:sodium:solute symporter family protein [Actinomycetota bacterium]
MEALKIAVVVTYVAILLYIAVHGARRTRSTSDFFLGGRSIGPWISAFAYGTTYFSAVLFVGYAGKLGWSYGFGTLWIVAGNVLVGTLLAWVLLARRTRRMSVRMNALTMPEFLQARYESAALKRFSAAVIFLFLLPYAASVYMGLSYLFENVLGIDYNQALIAMAALTGIYLVTGGYFAVTLTDFVQGSIMLAGSALLVAFVLSKAGQVSGAGMAGAFDAVRGTQVPQPPNGPPAWLGLLSLVVLTSLGPLGLPQMVQKFYSVKGEPVIRKAAVVSTAFALICTFGAYFSGAFTRVFFSAEKVREIGADNLMPVLINDFLPAALTIMILLLILSASMSTLSSLVLVSSSAVAIDLAGGEQRLGEKRSTMLMRALCALFVAVSLLIALKPWTFIVNMMAISWGTVTGAFIAPYIYGLFWRKATRAGAWAAMLAGMACSLGLSMGLSAWWAGSVGQPFSLSTPWVPFAGAVSMLVPLAVLPAVSSFTRRPSREALELAFGEDRGARRP